MCCVMFLACCSLLVVGCWLLAVVGLFTWCLVFGVRYALFVVCCLLFVVCCSLLVARRRGSSFVVFGCNMFLVICWYVFVAKYRVFVV